MITEDYVSFEIAKLLKANGFDEDIDLWYDENGEMFIHPKYDIGRNWRVRQGLKIYQCSTLQMAMKWLREKHHVVIDVCLEDYITEVDGSLTITYTYTIWYFNRHLSDTGKTDIRYTDETVDGEEKNSYEEACEAAIRYCLENLI